MLGRGTRKVHITLPIVFGLVIAVLSLSTNILGVKTARSREKDPASEVEPATEVTLLTLQPDTSQSSDAPNDTQNPQTGHYQVTTSDNDPNCDTGFNGYVDLESYGIRTNPNVHGNTIGAYTFREGKDIEFFGKKYDGLIATDDGIVVFGVPNYAGNPDDPQQIASVAKPNSLAALLWQDMEIVYDRSRNRGVTFANYGEEIVVVEYDDLQLQQLPNERYDFEIIMRRNVDNSPGAYEIVYAYDNLRGTLVGNLTIGVEGEYGVVANTVVNMSSAVGKLHDGLMICFNYNSNTPPPPTPTATPNPTPEATPTTTPERRLGYESFLPAVVIEP